MTLKYLIQKEFLQIRRNPFLPKLIIMFPIVIMCVMPWVMQMEVKNIVVDVVDNDRSTRSQQIVHRIEAMRKLMIMGVGIGEVMKEVTVLALMTVIFLTIALKKFNVRLE